MNFIHHFLTRVVLILLLTTPLYAQQKSEAEREIMVFFSDGVTIDAQGRATALPSSLDSLLSRFKMDSQSITSAFPNFRKSDTLTMTESRRAIKMPDMSRVFKIKMRSVQERDQMIEVLKKMPNVLFAEPNGISMPTIIPNDPSFGSQWALRNTGQNGGTPGADIKAAEAWDIYTGNPNHIIAIIDLGVDASHPDLIGKVLGDVGYSDRHGTLMAGSAAANTNNAVGIAGVDWQAKILS